MKKAYNTFLDFLDSGGEFSHFKWFLFFLGLIMFAMFIFEKIGIVIEGRGGNPQESYQEEQYDY